MTNAELMLDAMAHEQGIDLHPDRHFHKNIASAKSELPKMTRRARQGPRTRENIFGSDQTKLHMDSGADMQLDHMMNFGEE